MKKTLLILTLVISCMMTSCKKDNNDNNNESSDPFVGIWKHCVYNKMEFKENGEFILIYNYYSNNPWMKKGSYVYNSQTSTLSLSYDSGSTQLAIVQSCSYDKIVYYNADNLYTYTLIRVE
ncbi:MAG: hypothetical protein II981_11750 [Bacteroidales bacterium]|nr:hypothetical protein [Bacteroidales bacterium]